MNRSQKILVIKVSYILLFIGSFLMVAFMNVAIETLAIILYPLITVLVLVWRSVREDYDVFLLDKLVFDLNNDLSEIEFLGKSVFRKFFTRLTFFKYRLHSEGTPQIHYDIANRGNSEVTLHDCKVQLLYPKEEVLTIFPLFETFRSFDFAENRFREEINYLMRKKLEKGGLHTRIFPLERTHKFMLIQIDVNTYRCEASNSYLFIFDHDYFYYAKCPKQFPFNRSKNFIIKNQANIQKFLQNC